MANIFKIGDIVRWSPNANIQLELYGNIAMEVIGIDDIEDGHFTGHFTQITVSPLCYGSVTQAHMVLWDKGRDYTAETFVLDRFLMEVRRARHAK